MAKQIVLDGKDISIINGGKAYAFWLYVHDAGKQIPVMFKQTQDLTSKLIGITEQGAMFFNDVNTALSGSVTITASPLDGSADVTATITLSNLIALAVGSPLAS